METILLSGRDVRNLVSMDEAISAVESAFRLHGEGKTQMPPKVYLRFERGDLRAMPAHLMGYAGVKWVNSHPDNRKSNLLTVMAVLILNDPSTGFPLAIMDGTYITSLRTGAGGGVAAKYLARKDSSIFGVVGCGTQAYFQIEAISKLFEPELIKCFDVNQHAMNRFREYCESMSLNCLTSELPDVCNCDVLITTTPSTQPVVKDEWIKEGTHINAIGADAAGKQELDEKILLRAKIIVDDTEQAVHGGEINNAISRGIIGREDIYGTLGEVVAGIKKGRESYEEITVFDSTGLATQDISVAKVVYEKAVEQKIGLKLNLIFDPSPLV